MNLYIGLMSGTSMDGIDAALVDVNTHTLICGMTRKYKNEAKQFLQAVLNGDCTGPAALSQLNTMLGREFAYAVHELLQTAKIKPQQVVAIGSHGQTICHDATAAIPYTVQLACPHTIAELTGIKVVADFRTRDLVLGGQGAPFAPIYHQTLFAQSDLPLAIINIGGIANVTYLSQNSAVSGYDIGPGNCLLDAWMLKHQGQAFDANGAWAATGKLIQPLLLALLDDPYFKQSAPKSLGKEYFSYAWLAAHLRADYAAQDIQATLMALTATTIAEAIKASHLQLKHVLICGGGVHNSALLDAIKQQLPHLQIDSTQALGIDPDYIEAMMFAWFADRAINNIPLDLSVITGAKKSSIYGVIYASGIDKGISHRV